MNPGGGSTQTGRIWEETIVPALERNYRGCYQRRVRVGDHIFGGPYYADFVIDGLIVSAKWQQVPGTAEQKLLYDIACLIKIVRESGGRYTRAMVVLGGEGFRDSTKRFLLAQRHREYLSNGNLVEVVTLETFLRRVNRRAL